MTHYPVSQLIISAAETHGYFVSRSLSKTAFGTSEYIYVSKDVFSEAVKVRVSDHGVTNIGRVMNEVHVDRNCQDIFPVIDEINFILNRSLYFTAEERLESVQAFNVETRELRTDDVVTEEFVSKKGDTIYRVTRTYRVPVVAWINERNGSVYAIIKK